MEETAYDPACLELAQHFLRDEGALMDRADELAAHLQTTIENWIIYERDNAAVD